MDGFEATSLPIQSLALDATSTLLAVGAGDHEVEIWTGNRRKLFFVKWAVRGRLTSYRG